MNRAKAESFLTLEGLLVFYVILFIAPFGAMRWYLKEGAPWIVWGMIVPFGYVTLLTIPVFITSWIDARASEYANISDVNSIVHLGWAYTIFQGIAIVMADAIFYCSKLLMT
jgi:hypothetical protein